MIKEVFINGERCVNLPGSDYYVTREGTMFKLYSLSTHGKRPGYNVTRGSTKKYYSKAQLAELYRKFIK